MSPKPKYGEKNARFKDYRQKHQPLRSLQKLVSDEKKLMELCPSYGQNKLGVQALPLPPEDRHKYESRKERKKANKGQTVQSQKVNARKARKEGGKRKPSTARTYMLPPDFPDPIVTVFPVDPSSQVSQLPTIQRATPDKARVRPRFHPYPAPSHSMPLVPMNLRALRDPTSAATSPNYQPPRMETNMTEHYALNTAYPGPGCHIAPQAGNASAFPPSPTSTTTSSLESDRGSPSAVHSSPLPRAWAERTASSTTPPSPCMAAPLDCRLSALWGGAPYEGHLNTVDEGPLARHSSSDTSSPALKKEDTDTPCVTPDTSNTPGNAEADIHHCLSHYHPGLQVRTCNSAFTGTASWTPTHQGRHSGPQYEPATAVSGLFRHHQRREQADGRAPSNAPGMSGPVRTTLETFNYQSAANSYTSQSVSHTRLTQPPTTAKLSAVTGYARDMAAPAPCTSHQVQQHNGAAVRIHTRHSSRHHVSTATSPSREHTVRVCSATIADTTFTPGINSSNQHRLSAPTTTNKLRPTRWTCTSASSYSELAHALGDDYSVAPYVNEAGPLIIAPPVIPQMGGVTIGSPYRYEPAIFASQTESMDEEMASAFEVRFGDRESFPSYHYSSTANSRHYSQVSPSCSSSPPQCGQKLRWEVQHPYQP